MAKDSPPFNVDKLFSRNSIVTVILIAMIVLLAPTVNALPSGIGDQKAHAFDTLPNGQAVHMG